MKRDLWGWHVQGIAGQRGVECGGAGANHAVRVCGALGSDEGAAHDLHHAGCSITVSSTPRQPRSPLDGVGGGGAVVHGGEGGPRPRAAVVDARVDVPGGRVGVRGQVGLRGGLLQLRRVRGERDGEDDERAEPARTPATPLTHAEQEHDVSTPIALLALGAHREVGGVDGGVEGRAVGAHEGRGAAEVGLGAQRGPRGGRRGDGARGVAPERQHRLPHRGRRESEAALGHRRAVLPLVGRIREDLRGGSRLRIEFRHASFCSGAA